MLTVRHFDFTEYLKARSAHPRLLSSLPPLEYLSNISNIPSSSDGIYSSSCRRCRFGSREEKKILGAIHYFLLRKGKRLFFENGWLWGDRQLYSWLIIFFLFFFGKQIQYILSIHIFIHIFYQYILFNTSSNLKFSNFEVIHKYLFLFIIRQVGVALEVGKKRKSLERFITLREREKNCSSKMGDHGMIVNYIFGW